MIPLQSGMQFFTEPDPMDGLIFGSIFLALIIIAVIGSKYTGPSRTSTKPGSSPANFSRFKFRRAARRVGLERDQIRLLERLAKEQGLVEPTRLFESRTYLDRILGRQLHRIDATSASEIEKNQKKFHLLNIRRTLDRVRPESNTAIHNTTQLQSGTTLTLITEDKTQYTCRIAANAASTLALEAPTTRAGETIVWDKETPLKVTFRGEDGALFGFKSQVAGYRKQRARHQLYIRHSNNVRSVQKRKSPRREFKRSAYYFPVRVVEVGSGRSKKKEAVVDNARRDLGTIEDISAGGCALRAKGALKKGSLTKISFELERGHPLSAFGKVRGVDPGYRGNLMHVMFTRVSREHMTTILSYVYGYESELER